MIVEVIKPDLSPSNYLGMRRKSRHIPVRVFIREPGFMGMNAERRVDEIISFSQFNSTIHMRWTITVADGDHGLHAGFLRTRNYLLAIGSKLFAIEMCVRVYKHSYLSMWGQPPSGVHAG